MAFWEGMCLPAVKMHGTYFSSFDLTVVHSKYSAVGIINSNETG